MRPTDNWVMGQYRYIATENRDRDLILSNRYSEGDPRFELTPRYLTQVISYFPDGGSPGFCSGSIVGTLDAHNETQFVVATAAHCLKRADGVLFSKATVVVGTDPQYQYTTTSGLVSPGFGSNSGWSDVGILEYRGPMPTSYLNVSYDDGRPRDQERVQIAGFGLSSALGDGGCRGAFGTGRQEETVYLVSYRSDNPGILRFLWDKNQSNTVHPDMHGATCFGDSGGPMVVDGALVAINSYLGMVRNTVVEFGGARTSAQQYWMDSAITSGNFTEITRVVLSPTGRPTTVAPTKRPTESPSMALGGTDDFGGAGDHRRWDMLSPISFMVVVGASLLVLIKFCCYLARRQNDAPIAVRNRAHSFDSV